MQKYGARGIKSAVTSSFHVYSFSKIPQRQKTKSIHMFNFVYFRDVDLGLKELRNNHSKDQRYFKILILEQQQHRHHIFSAQNFLLESIINLFGLLRQSSISLFAGRSILRQRFPIGFLVKSNHLCSQSKYVCNIIH